MGKNASVNIRAFALATLVPVGHVDEAALAR